VRKRPSQFRSGGTADANSNPGDTAVNALADDLNGSVNVTAIPTNTEATRLTLFSLSLGLAATAVFLIAEVKRQGSWRDNQGEFGDARHYH